METEDLFTDDDGLQLIQDRNSDLTESASKISGLDFYNDTTTTVKSEDFNTETNYIEFDPVNIFKISRHSKKSKSRRKDKPKHSKPADPNSLPFHGGYMETTDLPRDCSDILEGGHNTSGIYTIMPKSNTTNKQTTEGFFCDMDTDGVDGRLVIQRRGFYPEMQPFDLNWQYYKDGFGNLEMEFWLGNDNIHALTNQGPYEIRFDLRDDEGHHGFAIYQEFRIDDESLNYTLYIDGYSGNL
ncbi:hypothetical protein CDAR_222311, partial [Caerostris darwini]